MSMVRWVASSKLARAALRHSRFHGKARYYAFFD
jgi:hypothetical protein